MASKSTGAGKGSPKRKRTAFRWWQLAVSGGFAVAGISKLLAVPPQKRLFASWGWKEDDMRIIGAAELGGAVLLATPPLRRLGAALLASTSTCIALAEIRHNDDALVTPRLAMLAAAVSSGI